MQVVTLAERHRRKMERMARAIVEIDAALGAYVREHGGRFIRHGSTATGRMRQHSDVDILVDFSDPDAEGDASNFAEGICYRLDMTPDIRPFGWTSREFQERAVAEGVVLA